MRALNTNLLLLCINGRKKGLVISSKSLKLKTDSDSTFIDFLAQIQLNFLNVLFVLFNTSKLQLPRQMWNFIVKKLIYQSYTICLFDWTKIHPSQYLFNLHRFEPVFWSKQWRCTRANDSIKQVTNCRCEQVYNKEKANNFI